MAIEGKGQERGQERGSQCVCSGTAFVGGGVEIGQSRTGVGERSQVGAEQGVLVRDQ